jgi:hypothetical protein
VNIILLLTLLAERMYTARLSTGQIRDAADFHAWLVELSEIARSGLVRWQSSSSKSKVPDGPDPPSAVVSPAKPAPVLLLQAGGITGGT